MLLQQLSKTLSTTHRLTIFERQKFEDRMDDGHDEGQAQEVNVCFQKSFFDRILLRSKWNKLNFNDKLIRLANMSKKHILINRASLYWG